MPLASPNIHLRHPRVHLAILAKRPRRRRGRSLFDACIAAGIGFDTPELG